MRREQRWLRPLMNLVYRRRRRATPWAAVDIGPHAMMGVVLSPSRQGEPTRVMKAARLTYEGALPDPAALAGLARELGAESMPWTLLPQRDEYRLSVMPAPQVPDAERVQGVRWQLASTLDFPAEDASIDVLPIPTRAWEPERAPELYAVAARGDAIAAYVNLFQEARLRLACIDIRETAQRNLANLTGPADELAAMLVFGRDEVQITFSWHGELYMDRLIAEAGANDESAARREAYAERMQQQVQRSLNAVRGSYPFVRGCRIVVAGAPDGFCTSLASALQEPVLPFSPEAYFDLWHVPELKDEQTFMAYLPAIGAALRGLEHLL